MLLILFGLSGAGKNFVGNILEKEFGYHYWDADSAILRIMEQYVLNRQEFTQDMRDKITNIIINKMTELKKSYQNIAVSQALYKIKNRDQIALRFPDVKFIQITATPENIEDRIRQRNDWVDQEYAAKISVHFEPQQKSCAVIVNNSDASSVILQLQDFLE